jgi:endonuclease/exonuclease/phosphatase family metal-dependent hydrolase
MKKYLLTFALINLGLSGSAQELSLMTYNIRYATINDGENQWEKRKAFLSEQLLFYAPDIFGIQEGLKEQVSYLDEFLQPYTFIGVGRDDGKSKGEYCAIFYNKDKFQLLGEDTFWLSETPEKVSKGWDAAYERICTYAFFKDISTGKSFWVFNTHFDHIGEKAREKSAELIVEKIKELNRDELPVFILGDFNLNEKSEAISQLSLYYNDARKVSLDKPFGPFGTFTGFEFHEPVKDRIDYIFCSKGIRVKKYGVLTDSKNGRYPSDHFPVMIQATVNAPAKD